MQDKEKKTQEGSDGSLVVNIEAGTTRNILADLLLV